MVSFLKLAAERKLCSSSDPEAAAEIPNFNAAGRAGRCTVAAEHLQASLILSVVKPYVAMALVAGRTGIAKR